MDALKRGAFLELSKGVAFVMDVSLGRDHNTAYKNINIVMSTFFFNISDERRAYFT